MEQKKKRFGIKPRFCPVSGYIRACSAGDRSGCQTERNHLCDRRERLWESTLLQSILCLPGRVKVTKGNVLFQGRNLHELSLRQFRTVRGTGIGVVFQEPGASLDPIRKICRQFYDAMHAHNPSVTRSEGRGRAAELLKAWNYRS